MIRFQQGETIFNYRAVGVARHAERVLLHRAAADDFWALPGGRAEMLEASPQTLVREMREELNETAIPERLLWVVENFFVLGGRRLHEVSLYWQMSFPTGSPVYQHRRPWRVREGDLELIFEWHALDALEGLRLLPAFLRRGLHELPPHAEHVIVDELAQSAAP